MISMEPSLLRTKLFVPPLRPDSVPRPRLTRCMIEGFRTRLVLISAPAGFGKTTLLCESLAKTDHPFAWISLDDADNDPVRFWTYFIAAFQTVYPNVGRISIRSLQSTQLPQIEPILTTLINEVADIPQDIVIVLDDYHIIVNQSIHDTMSFFIDHLPPQIHLAIATRVDPPLPLTRLRGRSQLYELRTADLRFTPDETEVFFNETMRLNLPDESVAALEHRTEGWIASLQMAAISMRDRNDTSNFVQAFSGTHHYIMDYLTEEVLQRQEEDVQSFLLYTSVLDRMTSPLCNALTGKDDGEQKLAQIEAANLFLVPLDEDRKWFRYHQLFADLLRSRLSRYQPDLLLRLYRRASNWFEDEDLLTEAVHYALMAEDYERAANLTESIAMSMISESRHTALKGWLMKLPRDLIINRPWLCVSLASIHLIAGDFDEVEPLLETAENMLSAREGLQPSATGTESNFILNHIIALRTTSALLHWEVTRTVDLCHEALSNLPNDQQTTRCLLTFNLGSAYWIKGELGIARRYLEESINLSRSTGNFFIALVALGHLADIQAKQGFLRQAAETNKRAIRLGTEWGGGEPLPATGYAFISLAHVLYEWNKIEEAMSHMIRGIELSGKGTESTIAVMAFPGLALLNQLENKTAEVSEALDRAGRIVSASNNTMISGIAEAWLAKLALARGETHIAERWAALPENTDLNLNEVPDAWSEFRYLTLVRLHIVRGMSEGIPDCLDKLRQKAEADGRIGSVIEALILQSLVFQMMDRSEESLVSFERALRLTEPEGYIRIFIDEGKPVDALLREAASRGICPDYVEKLLRAFELPESSADQGGEYTEIHLSHPLTTRELEVLKLMSEGSSSREIASELFVSVDTVKKHIKNIYAKLDVHKQTMAVTRARELGLV